MIHTLEFEGQENEEVEQLKIFTGRISLIFFAVTGSLFLMRLRLLREGKARKRRIKITHLNFEHRWTIWVVKKSKNP